MASISSKSVKLTGSVKKIDSPLAKYNSAGQLTCIVCNSVIKSEMVWTAHINGRQHRDKVLSLKKPNIESQFIKPQATPAVKRKADSIAPAASPSKKGVPADFFDDQTSKSPTVKMPIKSILKNSSRSQNNSLATVNRVEIPSTSTDDDMEVDNGLELPSNGQLQTNTREKSGSQPGESTNTHSSNAIPEGFFDDPKMDAKVRHIEFKDPVEEEWNKFQKEINDEVTASVAIQEEDQEESTAERQLEEIEEQMLKWGRVLELEQKKELFGQRVRALRESMVVEEETTSSDDDDHEMDKFFDWRSKAT